MALNNLLAKEEVEKLIYEKGVEILKKSKQHYYLTVGQAIGGTAGIILLSYNGFVEYNELMLYGVLGLTMGLGVSLIFSYNLKHEIDGLIDEFFELQRIYCALDNP